MFHAFGGSRSTRGAIVFLLVSAPLAAANGIRVVDNPSLPTFTSLQAAIDAAPDGGLLLVQGGTYGPGTVDGKSLSIVKMQGASPITIDSVIVRNLSGAQHVLLSGLFVHAAAAAGVKLMNDAGTVRLQDCTIIGGRTYVSLLDGYTGNPAVDVQSSTQVVVSHCTLTGGDAYIFSGQWPLPGGHGVAATNSNVALYDSLVTGGHGGEEGVPNGGDGGDGCHASGWGIFASGCDIHGGAAGGGDYIGCHGGGAGGDALDETNAQVHYLDCQLTAGMGGWESCGGPYGPNGRTIRSSGGLVNPIAGTRRKLAGASLSADDAFLTLTITGQPGDRFYLSRSWSSVFAYQPAWHGVWTVSTIASGSARAIIPAGGVLTLQVRAQDVVGVDHRLEYLQGFGIDSSGFQFLTGPIQVEHLDALGGPDCDSSGTNDFIQMLGGAPDCNRNIRLDTCDIASGTSQDANQNGIPDECPGG